MPDVLAWYHLNMGADNMPYEGSPEERLWKAWHGAPPLADAAE